MTLRSAIITGTANININGTVGATTANTGAFTTITATSIKFGSGTVLSSYEEGTWTPTDASGASLSFSSVTATYTRIGRSVSIQGFLFYPTTASVATAVIGGLPYTAIAADFVFANQTSAALYLSMHLAPSTKLLYPQALYNGNGCTNVQLSGAYLMFSGTYFV